MKVTKIFGCVLGLHLCIIAVLLVQPGCQTGQPPTQTHTQNRAIKSSVDGASRTTGDMIPADRVGGLDSAFNAGLEGDTGYQPIDTYEPMPALEPLGGGSGGQTVDIAGSGYQTYTVKKGDSLWKISKNYGVTLNELYAANGLNKNSILKVGQQIQIPGEGSTVTVNTVTPEVYQPSGFNQETTSYTVQRGDTLSRIANKFDTTVGAIKAANSKSSDMIRVGEVLSVPVGANANASNTSTAAPATTVSASSTTRTSFASSGGATQTHTVKAGEYPAKIAKQYGMTTSELLAVNGITDPRKLRVGQQLTVSGTGSPSNVDSRVETVAAPRPAPVAPAPPVTLTQPTDIRVIEADPLVEGEFPEPEPESDDDVFGGAVEIPVIRLAE